MSADVKLPELGEGVTEGELIKYLVKVGDTVKPDQPVAEFMTDKATVEVPSPVAGVVKELKFKTGDIVQVEKTILLLEAGAAKAATAPAAAAPSPAAAAPAPTPVTAKAPAAAAPIAASAHSQIGNQAMNGYYPPVADSRVLATPSTRRLARELNIDINQVSGSGLAQRVTREDILVQSNGAGAVSAKSSFPTKAFERPAAGQIEERVALVGIRKKIAEKMQMAKHVIPHFTLMDEAEVTELVALRESMKADAEKMGIKITYLPFVMKALISSARKFPMFNASIDDQAAEIVYKKYFNVGFAADTPNGLVVPVIKNADQKTLAELSAEILDLSKRARDGKLKPEEMKGATITITNIGSVGGTYATPIINHPEVAILGMYKISDRLVLAADKTVQSVKVMNFTITADHRLIDGAVAANFLKEFIGKIQKPGLMMMDMI
jgi:pyruvate dehydrogenase E2 component (dihydrolipoamide acetyltransferase)